jgi:hypothetical protein
MRPKHILAILVLLALAAPASPAHAGGIVSVCDEAHLLTALSGGGMVTFACSGTITLTAEIVIAADTTIDGSGQAVTISGNNAVRVFTVKSGVTLNLNELTVADGAVTNFQFGGAIYNNGALTVSNSTFFGNSANTVAPSGGGGGIYNGIGTVSVSNSTFSTNTANTDGYWGGGGGIYNRDGTVIVTNSTFSENSSNTDGGNGGGGGIYNGNGTVIVSTSIFSDNRASRGGGIYNEHGGFTVNTSTFSDNSASEWGGGIQNDSGTLTVGNSTFASNSASAGGGGISGGRTLTVTNCTFAGNTAGAEGGGIYSWSRGTLTMSNSTFFGNSAGWHGGGVYIYVSGNSGMVTVTNSTFSSNSATYGGGIYNDVGTVTLENTIVANSPAGNNCTGAITDGGGNLSYPDTTCPGINADPLLGPLQDNGGPTDTMALGIGSAAIDAGIDAICAALPVNNLDQRGVTRPQGPHCDIGAVEQILEPAAVSLSALSAQSLPGTITPKIIASLFLAVLLGVGVRHRHCRVM